MICLIFGVVKLANRLLWPKPYTVIAVCNSSLYCTFLNITLGCDGLTKLKLVNEFLGWHGRVCVRPSTVGRQPSPSSWPRIVGHMRVTRGNERTHTTTPPRICLRGSRCPTSPRPQKCRCAVWTWEVHKERRQGQGKFIVLG